MPGSVRATGCLTLFAQLEKTNGEENDTGKVRGKRQQGRAKTSYGDNITRWIGRNTDAI